MIKALLKSSKIVEMHPKPKKWPKYPWNLKITKIPLKHKKMIEIPLKHKKNYPKKKKNPQNRKMIKIPQNLKNNLNTLDQNTLKT